MDIKDRILIVEDDKSIRNFFKTVLEANNYDVLMANTGTEAYSMITSQCPDVVILDLIGERDAGLTQNEYKIVSLLGKYGGKVLTYDFIIKEIWGPNMKNDNRILRVNMANIRRKIEKNPAQPKYIFTEVGVGYRIADPD